MEGVRERGRGTSSSVPGPRLSGRCLPSGNVQEDVANTLLKFRREIWGEIYEAAGRELVFKAVRVNVVCR